MDTVYCGHFTVYRLIFQITARRLVILPVLFRNLLHLLGRRSGSPFSVVLCVYQTAGIDRLSGLGFAAYVHSDVCVSGGVEEFGHGFKDQFAVVLGRQWLRADQKLSERESKHRIEQLFPPRRLHEPYWAQRTQTRRTAGLSFYLG